MDPIPEISTATPVQSAPPSTPSKKRFPFLLLLPIIVLPVLSALIAYLFAQNMVLRQQLAKIQTSPSPILTPATVADPTARWRTISRKNWQFKIPANWGYLECNDDAIYTNPGIIDATKECNFGPSGTFWASKSGPYKIPNDTLIPTDTEIYTVVSNTKSILIDGKHAILQEENHVGGQGAGKYLFAYIQKNQSTYIFGYTDIDNPIIFDQILSTFKFLDQNTNPEGKFCGGIAANLPQNQCPEGYTCKMKDNYPDASGVCVINAP
ncbi:hypothetical protein HY948_01410 [Candidatus Gottesmanbacteria bacterium]|nr:hypothetical protein [Candidatus Gottesmanbacteria bacterium]